MQNIPMLYLELRKCDFFEFYCNDFFIENYLVLRRSFHINSCRRQYRYGTLDVEKVKGKIVVCLEDEYLGTFHAGAEAFSAGAVGMILASEIDNFYDSIAYPHLLPTSYVNYADSQYVYTYIRSEK